MHQQKIAAADVHENAEPAVEPRGGAFQNHVALLARFEERLGGLNGFVHGLHDVSPAARLYAILRPTAGAMMRNSSMSLENCGVYSDCAPSEKALSGL